MSQPNNYNNDNNQNNKRRRRRRNKRNNNNNNNNNNNHNNNNNRNNNNYGNNNNSKWNNNGWNKPSKPYSVCCNSDGGNWTNNNYDNNVNKMSVYKTPYIAPYFDSHCHLDWILFKSGYGLRDLPTFSKMNFSGNFDGCITVSCAADMIRPVSELINSKHIINKNIYGAFGLHPHNAKEWNDTIKQQIVYALKTGEWNINQNNKSQIENNRDNGWICLCGQHNNINNVFCQQCTWEPTKQYLENQEILKIVKENDDKKQNDNDNDNDKKQDDKVKNNKVAAVGECGLDFHYNRSPQHIQKKVFIEQIEISKQLDLPLVVHSRKAEQDTIEIMKRYCPKNKRIHLHCFTDSLKYGKIMLTEFKNLCIGFTGAITFKKADNNRNTVQNIPLNRILLETDGPYMSPDPYRGKVSHPGYIPIVAEQIAKLHGIHDVNKVLQQCRLNVTKVYGI